MTEETSTQQIARALPLWKSWVEDNESRFEYGATFGVKELSEYLDLKPQTIAFEMAVANIRRVLRYRGMHLTAQGGGGQLLHIAPAAQNRHVVKSMDDAAERQLQQAWILGAHTDRSLLTEDDARRHEKQIERTGNRLALLTRQVPKIGKSLTLETV